MDLCCAGSLELWKLHVSQPVLCRGAIAMARVTGAEI